MQENKIKNKTSNTYCDTNECSFYHYYDSVFPLYFIVFISMKNSVGKILPSWFLFMAAPWRQMLNAVVNSEGCMHHKTLKNHIGPPGSFHNWCQKKIFRVIEGIKFLPKKVLSALPSTFLQPNVSEMIIETFIDYHKKIFTTYWQLLRKSTL